MADIDRNWATTPLTTGTSEEDRQPGLWNQIKDAFHFGKPN